ncbi:MAG: WD40 repeat domain-containing protein, partial [Abditibacteriaceae bacterium]
MKHQYSFLLAIALSLTCHVSSARANILAIAFSPDSEILATASGGFVALMGVQSGKQIGGLSQPVGSNCLAFSPDGKTLVVGVSGDGIRKKSEIWIWDVAKRQVLLKRITSDRNLSKLVFSPDGHTLVTGSQNKMCLWDTRTWQVKSTLKEGNISSVCFAFSPDGNYLVVGECHSWESIDYLNERASAGGLELWDMKKLRLKHTFQKNVDAVYTVTFS